MDISRYAFSLSELNIYILPVFVLKMHINKKKPLNFNKKYFYTESDQNALCYSQVQISMGFFLQIHEKSFLFKLDFIRFQK